MSTRFIFPFFQIKIHAMIPDLLKHFLRSNELSELFHIINNENNNSKTRKIGKETQQNKSESAINQAYNCYNSQSKVLKKYFCFSRQIQESATAKVELNAIWRSKKIPTQTPSSGRNKNLSFKSNLSTCMINANRVN